MLGISKFLCEAARAKTATSARRNSFPVHLMTATQEGNLMRYCALVLAVVGAATAARAQDAIPDVKGTWSGKGKVIIFGGHAHHPGVGPDSPPTVRDIFFQAEDGIRDYKVTGVQTCALPI